MTALEEIQEAIGTLERLRADSTIGPWGAETIPETSESRIIREFEFFGVQIEVVAPSGLEADDANLIVTLHRTIDAQLAILEVALAYGELGEGHGSRFIMAAKVLARAINGEAS